MLAKFVYNIDPVTRAFIGVQECYKSSIDPDTWHWVGTALEVQPPPVQANEIAVASSDLNAWSIKPYFVGTIYWLEDGSKHEITEIGVTLPANALLEEPVIPDPPQTIFTALQFLEKFTNEEQLAVAEATLQSAVIKLWYDKLLAADYVDLNDERTQEGVTALVGAGLLTEQRKTEILVVE